MTFVITSPCIDTKDKACVDVCPVDCIHFEDGVDTMLFINPVECIDCGACEPACPVTAIFEEGGIPDDQSNFIEINALWYDDPSAARAKIGGGTPEAIPEAIPEVDNVDAQSDESAEAKEQISTEEAPAIASNEPEKVADVVESPAPVAMSSPQQIEASDVITKNQSLPSPASILALIPFLFLFIISWIFPGPIIFEIANLKIGIITISSFLVGNIFLLLFMLFEGKSIAKFSSMGHRDVLVWRDKPAEWRKSEESRRLDIESVVKEIAKNSFAYPTNEHPALKTFVNLPEPELGIEIVGGIGGRIYPDIIVAEQPGNYPKLIGQIESAETVTREQAERVWSRLDNADSVTFIFVPTGHAARAKDYIRSTGIRNVQVRTWKRTGNAIRVLVA